MKKRILAVFCLWLLMALPLLAAESKETFQGANKLYEEGKFSEAAAAYDQLVQTKPSAELYYNLGNAHFKNKEFGKAILDYERAKRLDPRDLDVRANLDYANHLIEYKVEDGRNWYLGRIIDLAGFLRYEECWLLFLAAYSIFLIGLFVCFLRRQPFFGKLGTTLLMLAMIASFPLLLKFSETGMKPEAVVTVKQAEVRYGPSTVDRIAFRLPEGLKASIQDHKQDWYRIRLKDNRSGWVRESEVSVV